MTTPSPACPHCARPGRPALCDPPAERLPRRGLECAVLVADWGHPTPCVDCEGLAGPELGWPGLAWMRDRFGLGWGEEMRAEPW